MPFDINGNVFDSFRAKLYNSTSFIRDGLICFLDAANSESYSGSGSTWYDLSGQGNNGTLYGSVSFNLRNNGENGVFVLPGSTGSYIEVGLNMSSSNYTVIGASRYLNAVAGTHTNGQGGRIISAKNNNWLMGQWYGYTENYYAEGWVSASGTGSTDTYWRIYAASGDISADQYTMYVNGAQTYQNTGGSAGPNGFSIGRYAPGGTEYANGEIGILLVYNRVLTAKEVLQMYQVIRPRYERYYDCGYGCVLYNYDPGCPECHISKAYSISAGYDPPNYCSGLSGPYSTTVYGNANEIQNVKRFFTDSAMTTAFNGGGKYYGESSGYAGTTWQISSDGYRIGSYAC